MRVNNESSLCTALAVHRCTTPNAPIQQLRVLGAMFTALMAGISKIRQALFCICTGSAERTVARHIVQPLSLSQT